MKHNNDVINLSEEEQSSLKFEIKHYYTYKNISRLLNIPYSTFVPMLNGYTPLRRDILKQIKHFIEEAQIKTGQSTPVFFQWDTYNLSETDKHSDNCTILSSI